MIRIRGLVKDYKVNGKTFGAVNGIDLDIPDGEFFTLLGPSGCGKSTLLRCICGLETPTAGEIDIHGTTVFSSRKGINVSPNKRRMGMVFQSYAIWPHMTVGGNVSFPLEAQKIGDRKNRVDAALRLVGLEDYRDRMAYRLSGGQQQRVALARAIAPDPKTLLLDEPLSNLDAALRTQMRAELSRLHQKIGLTTIFVTHDQEEALSLSNSIALLRKGSVVEVASPEDLYKNPRTLFSAEFLGAANVIQGQVGGRERGITSVVTGFGLVKAGRAPLDNPAPGASRISMFVRPEDIVITRPNEDAAQNSFAGKVLSRGFIGHAVNLEISMQDGTVLRCNGANSDGFQVGDAVQVAFCAEDVGLAWGDAEANEAAA